MNEKSKRRYPFNQIQLGATDTTNIKGRFTSVGYGEGNMDPHQMGYLGQTVDNKEDVIQSKKRRSTRKGKRQGYTKEGNGTFPDYPVL